MKDVIIDVFSIFTVSNQRMQTASKKVINSWAMYDWANSAYNLVITSTIFPAYYDAITSIKNSNGQTLPMLRLECQHWTWRSSRPPTLRR